MTDGEFKDRVGASGWEVAEFGIDAGLCLS